MTTTQTNKDAFLSMIYLAAMILTMLASACLAVLFVASTWALVAWLV